MSVFRFLVQVQAMGTAFLAERIINFLLTLVLARRLGAEGFGLYATALSIAGLLEYLLELGLGPVLIRRTAQASGGIREWVARAVAMKAVLLLGCVVLVGFLTSRWGSHPDLPLAAAMAVGCLGLFSIGETYAAVLSGLRRFGERGMLLVVYRGTNLTALALALALGVVSVPLLLAVSTGVALLYIVGIRHRVLRHTASMAGSAAVPGRMSLLREGFPFMTGNLLGAVPLNLPTVAVSLMAGLPAAGAFQVAYKLYLALGMIPAAVGYVAFPHMAARILESGEVAWERFRRGNGLLLLVGTWAGFGLFALATPTIRVLFGEGYGEAESLLRVLAVGTPFFFLHHTAAQALGAVGRQGRVVWAQASAAGGVLLGAFLVSTPLALAAVLPLVEILRYFVFSVFIQAEVGRSAPTDWWMAPAALGLALTVAAVSGWTLWGLVLANAGFAAWIGVFWGRRFSSMASVRERACGDS